MKGSIRQRTPGSYELTIDIAHIELTKLAPDALLRWIRA